MPLLSGSTGFERSIMIDHQADQAARTRLDITIGEDTRTVIIRAIADKRGSAMVAQALYEETAESIEARERARDLRKFAAAPGADLHGRPTKRDRRRIDRFGGL